MSAATTANLNNNKDKDKTTDELPGGITVLAQNMSMAALYGACTGSVVKKFSRDVAYGIGLGFIFLQSLSYYGFISIHWGQVNKRVQQALDADGDGKFDMNDVKVYAKRLINFLSNGLPDAAGFSVGFYWGLRNF